MQPTPDKDFDQLFKDAFADAEVTPSRNLWSDIEQKIEPKKTRKLPVYWLAAAAVLVITTVGILIRNNQDTTLEKPENFTKTEVNKPSNENVAKPELKEPVEVKEEVFPKLRPEVKKATSFAKMEVKKEEKQKPAVKPEIVKEETLIASAEVPKAKQEDLTERIKEAVAAKNETLNASTGTAVLPDEPVNENEQSKGIRNVGDLVNLVVNKVDKRKDKFIQFRTDDDDSSISSINIGPFKFGKRKKADNK
ncbi:hypothetical protein [Pedobacter punctiformis]|uniref:Uncharacterized protein n=1 Tax=Pedobacter punctiformis TaxID=3004097 RepID=A0ABT4L3F2_9SPHI|nr:hypothetical protein [Pedobacter sp. HCMS5-2]MCZ4242449.1 hypothetical protein [Pedobacter sp. HCMS5-2]